MQAFTQGGGNLCMQTLVRKTKWRLQSLTVPSGKAGRSTSICNKCPPAVGKDIHFALQMRRNILSLLAVGRKCFNPQTGSLKTLSVMHPEISAESYSVDN